MGDLNGIAVHRRAGRGPTIVFLPGYASDMAGSKALAIDDWAARTGRAFVRFDYRGWGESAGAFEDFTLEDWRNDALAVIDSVAGSVLLVGSSMGGWLMLLAALARPERVAALVGIAAAPDFTEWGFGIPERARIRKFGRIEQPSSYGSPLVTTRKFYDSARTLQILNDPINLQCPVRLLHGLKDREVPYDISVRAAEALGSADVQVTLVKDGDHRLSRPQDIDLLIATIESLS